MPESAAARSTIDVFSDVVCPWCFIGKRRLEAALARHAEQRDDAMPVVRWQPFQLNPGLPPEGIERSAYLEAKFGGPARSAQIYARVREAGKTVGIPFDFDAITRQPNTRDAHRLIAWAQDRGDPENLVERLFRAYFLEGRSIGEHRVLAAIAGEAGLDAAAATAFLATNEGIERVDAMARRSTELRITGVPFFIFNGRLAVSGAHEPDVLLDALNQSSAVAVH